MDRLAKLKALIAENSQDRFARYALAMEYAKQGSLEEAVAEFRTLLSFDADYVGAYLQFAPLRGANGTRAEPARALAAQRLEPSLEPTPPAAAPPHLVAPRPLRALSGVRLSSRPVGPSSGETQEERRRCGNVSFGRRSGSASKRDEGS
jgi:hypothetical protein